MKTLTIICLCALCCIFSVKSIAQEQRFGKTPETNQGGEYLIIAPDFFLPLLENLRVFRMRQGIATTVVGTSETGPTAADIESFINDAVNTWTIPPESVLLVGDHDLLPSPVWNSYCVSDNIYADVDSDDLPDVFISRIPVITNNELATILDKIISFETDPVEDSAYYMHPLACTDFTQPVNKGWMVSEILNGYFEQMLGKAPQRQYTGSVPAPPAWPDAELLAIFGPNGLGYIPSTPDYLSAYTNGNAIGINNDLNAGAMTFTATGISSNETGWTSPAYNINDFAGLSNDPTFLVTMNSLNGKFNFAGSNCFAEAFLKNPHGGIGVIAASEVIYSTGNEWFTIGFMDGLWDDFYPYYSSLLNGDQFIYPCRALLSAKYFLNALVFPVNPEIKKTFYYLYHYFGDPYSVLNDRPPGNLTVVFDPILLPGQLSFEIQADSGSVIALVHNDHICAVVISTGSFMTLPVDMPVVNDTLHITVTKQNFKRFHSAVVCQENNGIWPEADIFSITVAPNPCHESVVISILSKAYQESGFIIRDHFGRVMKQWPSRGIEKGLNTIELNLPGLKSGIYFFELFGPNNKIIRKLIVC